MINKYKQKQGPEKKCCEYKNYCYLQYYEKRSCNYEIKKKETFVNPSWSVANDGAIAGNLLWIPSQFEILGNTGVSLDWKAQSDQLNVNLSLQERLKQHGMVHGNKFMHLKCMWSFTSPPNNVIFCINKIGCLFLNPANAIHFCRKKKIKEKEKRPTSKDWCQFSHLCGKRRTWSLLKHEIVYRLGHNWQKINWIFRAIGNAFHSVLA